MQEKCHGLGIYEMFLCKKDNVIYILLYEHNEIVIFVYKFSQDIYNKWKIMYLYFDYVEIFLS